MNKALFLDLDGTLIKTKSGETFPKNIHDWEFKLGMLPKIQMMYQSECFIIIVTNQAGIEAGHITEIEFLAKISNIIYQMEEKIHVPCAYWYCDRLNSYKRKPNPGMAYEAATQLELDLSKYIMVGDASGLEGQFSDSDKMFAENAGIGTYYDISEFLKL